MKRLSLTFFILLAAVSLSSADSLKGMRPNIILVMTDDQGMGDLACLGNPILKTPHLDQFHKDSTRFTDFHVSPTCAPTRAALMTSRHEFRNGVTHTVRERELMDLAATTLPQLLRKGGYETGIFGKWHLGDEDAYQPYNRGFSEVFIHGAGGIGQSFPGSCGDFPPNKEEKGRYFDNVILHNDTIVQTKGFCTDVFFDATLGWVEKMRKEKKPYFAYLTPNAPHGPFIAPENNKKRFLDEGWSEMIAGRYGMMENLDENFGKLVAKMNEWGAWEDTLVIFMTDNGQAGGNKAQKNGETVPIFRGGFKSGKGSSYEGGTHVPAFWRWDGVTGKGVDIKALTAHLDFLPTFCELAGVEIPTDIQKIEGRSMVPLLEDPSAAWADRELFVHAGRWEKGADPELSKYKKCAVRTKRWRFVNGKHLYDILADPFEENNVAGEYPEVVAKLKDSYEIWWAETVPLMINEDRPFAKEQPQAVRYEKQLAEQGIPDWVGY